MPDATPTRGPTVAHVRPSFEVVLTALADAVLAVPGVVRLEPTLRTSGPRVLLGRRPTDGLHVLERSGMADVEANVATSSSHQARTVAHQIRACITELLGAHGYTPGSVAVSVLTISPDTTGPDD